jgi:hypothetical protein
VRMLPIARTRFDPRIGCSNVVGGRLSITRVDPS